MTLIDMIGQLQVRSTQKGLIRESGSASAMSGDKIVHFVCLVLSDALDSKCIVSSCVAKYGFASLVS